MLLAAAAGVRVFVTGGIGGVHRGGESTWDVSADLSELGRTPVAVVCAGAKSILDIPRTLEVLETQGVAVRLNRSSPSLATSADGPPARAGCGAGLGRVPGLLHAIQRRARAVAPGDAGRGCCCHCSERAHGAGGMRHRRAHPCGACRRGRRRGSSDTVRNPQHVRQHLAISRGCAAGPRLRRQLQPTWAVQQ